MEQQIAKPRTKRGFLGDKRDIDLAYRSVNFNDPYWDKEWYLVRYRLEKEKPFASLQTCYKISPTKSKTLSERKFVFRRNISLGYTLTFQTWF